MAEKRLKIPQIIITVADSAGKPIKVRKHGPFLFKRHVTKWGETWYLKDKSHKQWGSICVAKHTNRVCVTNTHMDEKLHGLGIGSKLYQHLVDYYSVLESDPNGHTSERAKKVWERLGAKKTVTNPHGYKITRYQLVSKINPPKENTAWTGMNSIWSMTSLWKLVRSIPRNIQSKSSSLIATLRRSMWRWTGAKKDD